MADIGKLMALEGAVAAGEFSLDGELIRYQGDLPEDAARWIAKTCAANSLMGATQAESFTHTTGMRWTPFHGWAVSAGDYSVCVVGHLGLFVETAKADFNAIFDLLSELSGEKLKAA
jgi:roadblock/LC7 domain-containing protein